LYFIFAKLQLTTLSASNNVFLDRLACASAENSSQCLSSWPQDSQMHNLPSTWNLIQKLTIFIIFLTNKTLYANGQMLENQLMEIVSPAIFSTSFTAQQTFRVHLKKSRKTGCDT
jgi:hypothetical protein